MRWHYGITFLGFMSVLSVGQAQTASQVTVRSELASPVMLANTPSHNFLKISLTGVDHPEEKRSPINMALVIDRSGSMSGDRIEKARAAAIMAINRLQETDRVSVIAYDNEAEVIIPSTKTDNKKALIAAINKVVVGGGTALFAGVSKGIKQVDEYLDKNKINRVVLLSDGEANIGPSSSAELGELGKKAAQKGIAVTTIGLGDGYNEDLMTTLAGYSDGNHAFVQNSADLEKAFDREFRDVMSVVAQEVIVVIVLDKGVKPVRLLGRDGEIKGNVITTKMNQLYANQEKYVLLEIEPANGKQDEEKTLADVRVQYLDLNNQRAENFDQKVSVRYSASEEVVRKAASDEIRVDSEVQKAALVQAEAIQLLDEGKSDLAEKKIKSNVALLDSLSSQVSSPEAKEKVESAKSANQALEKSFDEKAPEAVLRKSMKAEEYKSKKQQK